VLDAPPTGRIARFLNVNSEVAGLARMGPVRQQADSVMNLIRSRQTAVHLVTLLEEMPVQETIDAVAELTKVNLPVGAVLVNMVREPLLPPELLPQIAAGNVDIDELARGLKTAGIDASDALLAALAGEAADHAGRVLLEQREREQLHAVGQPTIELPMLSGTADLAGLYELARQLQQAGF
jgi:anion-transporting  ArsA/GET3 family ATPase